MEGYHNPVLITGDKFSFGINLSIFQSFNSCNSLNILFPRSREQDESHRHFVFHCKLSKLH